LPRDTAAGIEWAAKNGARVISLSVGSLERDVFNSALAAAATADAVVVAGVGNLPRWKNVAYPAASPGVLAVAGVDRSGKHAAVSVTGPEVALSAPAVDIVSTAPNGEYRMGTGTSDATAIVAGAAALVRARYPKLSAPEVIHRLTATATDNGVPGRDVLYGYGVLNLVAALTADVPPIPPSTPTGGGTVTPSVQPSSGGHFPAVPVAIVIGALVVAAAVTWVVLRQRGDRR
jgi:subtilisin family serine protease